MPRKAKAPAKKKKPTTSRSGFERKVAAYLKEKKVKFAYEAERIKYTVPASKHAYVPDYVLLDNGIIVEAKGNFDRSARKKMALVVEQNPDRDIRILFMRNNTISKKSRTTYEDWCAKHNIKCATNLQGHIPEEWLQHGKD